MRICGTRLQLPCALPISCPARRWVRAPQSPASFLSDCSAFTSVDQAVNIEIRSASNQRNDLRRIGTHPDYWYPVAWSRELKPCQPLGVRFAGEPIVVYRGASGRAFALEDRCAHRQVPLHMGTVHGDGLKCGYHGWTYDCAGKCIEVPYLGAGHLPNGVRSYPVHEIDGMIFVFPGNPEFADARRPVSAGAKADQRYLTRRLYREVACHYTFMHENLSGAAAGGELV